MPRTVAGEAGFMGAPEISVVMSVFNGQRYLAAAMDSILAQTMRDFELIVVDDGSTDGSSKLLQTYAAKDPRVHFLTLQNGGLTRALNLGIGNASGEWIARMDADDVAEPERLAVQAQRLKHDSSIVALGSALTLIDPDGEKLIVRSFPTDHAEIDAQLLNGNGVIPHPSAMFQRKAWTAIGGYREKFACAQDLDLWLRLGEMGRLANLEQPLLRYRMHSEAISSRKRAEQLDCARQAVEDARVRRGLNTGPSVLQSAYAVHGPAKILRSWSRMALKGGNLRAARKHALAALRHSPLSPSNIGLAAKVLLESVKF